MINLLSEKKIKFDKKTQTAVKVKMWSGVVLVVYMSVMVLAMVVSQVMMMRSESEKKALEKAKLDLSSQVVLVEHYESVIDRSGVIKKILAARRESIGLWNTIKGMLPIGVELTQFGLEENALRLSFKAPHVVLANQMLDVIETQFSQLESQKTSVNLSRMDDASYTVNANVLLP